MRCLKHSAEAVAICAYCGRALCPDCVQSSSASRMVCSGGCAEALSRNEQAMQTILRQGAQSARASAFYCYLCGGLSAAAGVASWFMLPSPFLMLFTGGCALVLTASGVWYGRIAGRQPLSELTPAHRVPGKDPDSGRVGLELADGKSPNREAGTKPSPPLVGLELADGKSPNANLPVETRP